MDALGHAKRIETTYFAVIKTQAICSPRLCVGICSRGIGSYLSLQVKLELRVETHVGYLDVLRHLEGKEGLGLEVLYLTSRKGVRQDGPLDWNTSSQEQGKATSTPCSLPDLVGGLYALNCRSCSHVQSFLPLVAYMLPKVVLAMPKPAAEGVFGGSFRSATSYRPRGAGM